MTGSMRTSTQTPANLFLSDAQWKFGVRHLVLYPYKTNGNMARSHVEGSIVSGLASASQTSWCDHQPDCSEYRGWSQHKIRASQSRTFSPQVAFDRRISCRDDFVPLSYMLYWITLISFTSYALSNMLYSEIWGMTSAFCSEPEYPCPLAAKGQDGMIQWQSTPLEKKLP